jgi:hypothetical protein
MTTGRGKPAIGKFAKDGIKYRGSATTSRKILAAGVVKVFKRPIAADPG